LLLLRSNRNTKKSTNFNIESELIYPLIIGDNIRPWKYELSTEFILWTHDSSGKVLDTLPRHAKKYFDSKEQQLIKRREYRKAGSKNKPPFWTIFRVKEDKLRDKIAWRELAPYIQCAPIPSEVIVDIANHKIKRKIIMKQTTYFLIEDDDKKAFCLSCVLNSTLIRAFLQSFSAKLSSGYFRHFSWNVGLIPIPIDKITDLQEEIGKNYLNQKMLDTQIGKIYGLTERELDDMVSFHTEITSIADVDNHPDDE
jgi:hypothetical protein